MSKVLVVTPTYCTEDNRRLPLLLQTIYWVRQQTHKDYLHIVVDDGSTDSTPSVLERLSQSDPKLKVFRKRNGGASAAINYGVERALAFSTPDYITICHSDDVLLPDSLEVRVQLARQRGADFVYTAEVAIRDPSLPPLQRRARREYSTSDELFSALLHNHPNIPYVTMLWGAEFFLHKLQGYDDRLTSAEDWDIALRSAKELVSIQGIHVNSRRVTVARRVHEDCLRIQNMLDGTKERCYEKILHKHLKSEEYRAAMAFHKKRIVKLRRQNPPSAVRKLIRRVLHSHVLKPIRRSYWTRVEIDPRVAAFLKEIDRVDYGLMDPAW